MQRLHCPREITGVPQRSVLVRQTRVPTTFAVIVPHEQRHGTSGPVIGHVKANRNVVLTSIGHSAESL